MLEAERAVDHWRFALEDYRKSHGLTARLPNPVPVLEAEYSHMGPTELVQFWSVKHDGEVVVKNLAKFAVYAGMSPNYRLASSSIYAVVFQRKGYDKIGPGHFKKSGNPDGHYADRTPLPIVYPSDVWQCSQILVAYRLPPIRRTIAIICSTLLDEVNGCYSCLQNDSGKRVYQRSGPTTSRH